MRKSNSAHLNDPFASNLRAALQSKCMTQYALAMKAGIHPSAISQYCIGAHFPRPDKIRKLAEALDVPVLDLLKGVVL